MADAKFNPDNTKVFGLNKWNVDIQINNHSGKEEDVWPVPSNIWYHLVLEQDLTDWPIKGLLTFHNPRDGLERFNNSKNQEDYDRGGSEDPDPPYFFRMDGRDEIIIRVRDGESDPTSRLIEDESAVELPADLWELHFDCVIYDVNDNESVNYQGKNKTLYFWDKRYQIMQEKNIQFSTAPQGSSHKSNYDRAIKTGLALQNLLIAAGFEDSIDKDSWDEGSGTIFYTSGSTSTVADDVKNILAEHISEKGDKCIFYFNRRLGEFGKWQLIPIHKFFDGAGKEKNKPGKLQIEHFFIEDYGEAGSGTTPLKSPHDPMATKLDRDINLEEFNKITNYEFVDMAGIDNAKAIISKPVYWYDVQTRVFGLDYNINEINKTKEKFQELYVDKLYAAGKPYPLMTLNKNKTEQYNVDPQYIFMTSINSYPTELVRSFDGSGNILFAGVFLNECVRFTVLGTPYRLPGTFIGIDRKGDILNNYLDNKLCGQWFVVNVKHIMYLDKYVNEVLAVKVHAYEKIKIKEDIE